MIDDAELSLPLREEGCQDQPEGHIVVILVPCELLP